MKKIFLGLLLFLLLSSCRQIERPEPPPDAPEILYEYPPETVEPEVETEIYIEPVIEIPPLILNGIIIDDLVNSGGAYLYNMSRDELVYSKNETIMFPPASILKIMTCLITLENIVDLNQIVYVPQVCFNEFESGDPNKEDIADAKIEPWQENLTYLDLLYGLMTASGCEASNVLAYNVAGGYIDIFVDMMNAKARELGCTDTNFTNAHGLFDPENLTSARDIFLITRYAYESYPLFKEIYEKESYDMPPNSEEPDGYPLKSGNTFLRNNYYFETARVIKTGSIDYFYEYVNFQWQKLSEGTTSLVSRAYIGDELFILVTIGAPFYFGPPEDEEGNKRYGMHYTFADHKFLYEAVKEALNL